VNRPDEPIDDRTMPSPGDPWAAADQPVPTVNLGNPTTYVSGATVHLDDIAPSGQPRPSHLGDATAHYGRPPNAHPGQPTAHLGGPTAHPGQPTAHLGGPTAHLGAPTDRLGQPTAPLGDATAHYGQPTAHLGQPTAPLGQPTAPLGQPTVHLGGPTAHLADPGKTVSLGSTDRTVHLPGSDPRLPATAHYAPTTHADGSELTVRAHNELRFGPGVPTTPVVTPVWPGATTPSRRRPLWRRLVSLLSSLLTLVLIGVVGFYIWQRLSPLEVEGVTVAVPEPAGTRCDVTVDVVATVRTNGKSGVIRYQWFRSDAPPGAVLTEQVGSGQRTAALTLKWTFSGVGTATETATVNIIEPSPVQVGTQVNYRCRN
jgi:hypothetical protein